MMSDFRFAVRQLLKTPGFTAVAVLMLGIALGINSGVFSLVESLVLHPVVPRQPDKVVSLFTSSAPPSPEYRPFSLPEYQLLRASRDTFADVAAIRYAQVGLAGGDGMRRTFALFTSDNFFALCGVVPEAGRYFTAEESRPNAGLPVVVASDTLWRRLGAREDFVGSTLRINNRAFTVVGISPAGFNGLNALVAPDVWLPLGVYADFATAWAGADLADPKTTTLNLIARLQDGVSRKGLTARLPALATRLTALAPPGAKAARILLARPVSRFGVNNEPTDDTPLTYVTLAFLGMAGCVLLIASLNLANMLLARGTTRTKEVALRLALGATRGRVIRLLLAEGLLLALAGGTIGLLIAAWSDSALLSFVGLFLGTMNLSVGVSVRPDAAVLGFTLLLCVAACLAFSLWPAVVAARSDVVTGLKQVGSEPTAADKFGRFFSARHILVMAQVALSLMLLFSSGLFLRGALKASGSSLGFETRGGLVGTLDFSLTKLSDPEAKAATFAALDRIRSLPGVQDAGVATMIPYGDTHAISLVVPAAAPAGTAGLEAWTARVTGGYTAAIGLHLLSGRDFTAAESAGRVKAGVVIIDERLAALLFPKGDALGQRITFTDWTAHPAEVIGICSGHRQNPSERDEHRAFLFAPLGQDFSLQSQTIWLQARLATTNRSQTESAIASLRAALHDLNPDLPLAAVTPFADVVDYNIESWLIRVAAALFGIFGGIALVLAVVGVYSIKAYAVTRRSREFGIRMALGAGPREILTLILTQGAVQTAVAIAVGTLLALGAGQVLASMLYHVSPADPLVLGVSAALLALAAKIACLIPARRATRLDPMVVLRAE